MVSIKALAHEFKRVMQEVNGLIADPKVDPFIYSVLASNLTNGATQTLTLQVESDADFIITHQVATVVYTTDKVPATIGIGGAIANVSVSPMHSWPILVQINVSGSGRNLFSRPTRLSAAFGPGVALPYMLPRPKLVPKNSTLSIELQRDGIGSVEPDGSVGTGLAALGFDVELAFLGIKNYDLGQANATR